MKIFRLFAFVLVAGMILASCSDDEKFESKRFSISITDDGNGSTSANVEEAEEGTSITLTASANTGFEFLSWNVVSGGITLEDTTANPVTFTMPAGDVSIKANFTALIPEYDDILSFIPDPMFKRYIKWRMNQAQTINDKLYGPWDTDANGKLSSKEAAAVVAMDASDLAKFFAGEGDSDYARSYKGLEHFTGLEYLDCGFARIASDADFDLSKLTKLKTIICDAMSDKITKIDFSHCPDLEEISCTDIYYELKSVDISKCTKLRKINFYCCEELSSLDVTNCPLLEELDVKICDLTTLDVSKNPELLLLEINYNPITSIDLSNNKKLIAFDAFRSSLNSIDLSNCPDLERLSISDNKLTELNLSKNKKLSRVSCKDNLLTKLNVSNSPNLETLMCNNNKLAELNIDNCPKLFDFYCHDNHLKTLDVRGMGFWFDSSKGELTNTYSLYAGLQTDASTGAEITINITMRPDQTPYWEALKGAGKKNQRTNVIVVE